MKIKFFYLDQKNADREGDDSDLYYGSHRLLDSIYLVAKIGKDWFKFAYENHDFSVYAWAEKIEKPSKRKIHYVKSIEGTFEQFTYNDIDVSVVRDNNANLVLACADDSYSGKMWFAYAKMWSMLSFDYELRDIKEILLEREEVG